MLFIIIESEKTMYVIFDLKCLIIEMFVVKIIF